MYKGIDLEYYGINQNLEEDDNKEEIEKEEKMMESMLYLEYLDKINNKQNLNIFNDNKDKNNTYMNDNNDDNIDKANDNNMEE